MIRLFFCFSVFIVYFGKIFANQCFIDDKLDFSLNKKRTAFKLISVKIEINPDILSKSFEAQVSLGGRMAHLTDSIQIDLSQQYKISTININGNNVHYSIGEGRDLYIPAYGFNVEDSLLITIKYFGFPKESKSPPWDGGWIWSETPEKKPWIGVACQHFGASSWFPCIDHPTVKPLKTDVIIHSPPNLKAVSNGTLVKIDTVNQKVRWHWQVKSPINLYNITVNIGPYETVTDTFWSKSTGFHEIKWHALEGNSLKAKQALQQAKEMLAIFEDLVGPYPFWQDGFQVVETPYWGMEHQSCIAYGNNYKLNKFGFDFILIHESGHEWFGNAITHADVADMWIHEGFTTYLETMFLRRKSGNLNALNYLKTQKLRISNKQPVVGKVFTGYKTDNDAYFKAAWMLETIKQELNDSILFEKGIFLFATYFSGKIISTDTAINFLTTIWGETVRPIFNTYLFGTQLPVLEVYKDKKMLKKPFWRYRLVSFDPRLSLHLNLKTDLTKRVLVDANWRTISTTKFGKVPLETENHLISIEKLLSKPNRKN